jgi:hypothetical protein
MGFVFAGAIYGPYGAYNDIGIHLNPHT